jgi:hypothetical protein
MDSAKEKIFTARRWWLEGGDEDCPHCGHPYHREAEMRCVACDAAGCRHCIVVHREHRHCPECVDTPSDD